jgi:putative NADH-flavin reductase
MGRSTIAVLNGTSRVNRHIIQQALANGQNVRAIVRSTSRFYAETAKHADLSAHEWSNFADLAALAPILDGVDVIYVALCASASGVLVSLLSCFLPLFLQVLIPSVPLPHMTLCTWSSST